MSEGANQEDKNGIKETQNKNLEKGELEIINKRKR